LSFTEKYGKVVEEYGNENYNICLTEKGYVICYYTDVDSGGYDSALVTTIYENKEEFLNNFDLPDWRK
jgi:hypothetical protein